MRGCLPFLKRGDARYRNADGCVVQAGGRQFAHQKDIAEGNAMKKTRFLSTAVILFSVMFLAGVCVAGGPPKPGAAKWTGTLYDVGYCDATHVMTVNIGQGVSTILGRASFVFTYCTPADGPGSGWGIVTTSTGDTIHVRITTLSVDLSQNPPVWSEHEVFIGGTGKFANATGEFDSQGVWTFDTDVFPYGTETPELVRPPQGWIGTTYGWMNF
jgi:hypothetical protein